MRVCIFFLFYAYFIIVIRKGMRTKTKPIRKITHTHTANREIKYRKWNIEDGTKLFPPFFINCYSKHREKVYFHIYISLIVHHFTLSVSNEHIHIYILYIAEQRMLLLFVANGHSFQLWRIAMRLFF